jgi:hypothetical protein
MQERRKTEDTLKVYPAARLTPELTVAIREHTTNISRILREDRELRRTGIIQSRRQVFELARGYFGFDQEGRMP